MLLLYMARARFSRFGLAVRGALTDNGPASATSASKGSCAKLHLREALPRAYRPQINGKAERFTETVPREWAYAAPIGTQPNLLTLHS